jgi:hypothetical protein
MNQEWFEGRHKRNSKLKGDFRRGLDGRASITRKNVSSLYSDHTSSHWLE